jgi:hypothetical protein
MMFSLFVNLLYFIYKINYVNGLEICIDFFLIIFRMICNMMIIIFVFIIKIAYHGQDNIFLINVMIFNFP